MMDLLREAPFGQIVRLLSRGKIFPYPEESPDFRCPSCYDAESGKSSLPESDSEEKKADEARGSDLGELEAAPTLPSTVRTRGSSDDADLERQPTETLQRTQTLPYSAARLQAEEELALARPRLGRSCRRRRRTA